MSREHFVFVKYHELSLTTLLVTYRLFLVFPRIQIEQVFRVCRKLSTKYAFTVFGSHRPYVIAQLVIYVTFQRTYRKEIGSHVYFGSYWSRVDIPFLKKKLEEKVNKWNVNEISMKRKKKQFWNNSALLKSFLFEFFLTIIF